MQYQFWAPEQHVVPCGARDSRYGWKETHGTAISASAGEVVYLCGDVKSRTQLVGEIGATVCMRLCV